MAKNNTKFAILVTSTVAVLCPHCSAEQPSPDNGSDLWLPTQIKAAAEVDKGRRICISCDEGFTLMPQSDVKLDI
jgi:hypothetical protein